MAALGSARWMKVTGITRVWPYEGLLMETEAVSAAWGSMAPTVYLEKQGKPWCTSFSTTAMWEDVDTTWRRGNTYLHIYRLFDERIIFPPVFFFGEIFHRSGFNLLPHFHTWQTETQRGSTSLLHTYTDVNSAISPDISEVQQLWHSTMNMQWGLREHLCFKSLLPSDPFSLQTPFPTLFPVP